MTDEWANLATAHGRRSVMSLRITDAQLDAETNRQIPLLFGMISEQILGHERCGLDFGCGSGRFSRALAKAIPGRVTAYDPCQELIALATGDINVDYISGPSDAFFRECQQNGTQFDVVMAAQVLGAPGLDLEATAKGLVDVLAHDGLLIVVDHMEDVAPSGRWWRFRPLALYRDTFARCGVELECVGELMQLDNKITVLAGRLP